LSKKRKREEAKQHAHTPAPALRTKDAHQSEGQVALSTTTRLPEVAETTLTGGERVEHPFQLDSDNEDNVSHLTLYFTNTYLPKDSLPQV